MSDILEFDYKTRGPNDCREDAEDPGPEKVCPGLEGLWLSPRALYRVEKGNAFVCCKVFDDHYAFWLGKIAMVVGGSVEQPRLVSAKQAFRSPSGSTRCVNITVEFFKHKLVKYFPDDVKNCTNGKIEIYTRILHQDKFL